MTNEKFEAVKALIAELLTDESVTFADPNKKEQIISGMALLYDQMLYEAEGKKIRYSDFRTVYELWHIDDRSSQRMFTLQEMADMLNTSVSTINNIVQGKYWRYCGYRGFIELETPELMAIRLDYCRQLFGRPKLSAIPVNAPRGKDLNEYLINENGFKYIKPGIMYISAHKFEGVIAIAGYCHNSKIPVGKIVIEYNNGNGFVAIDQKIGKRVTKFGYGNNYTNDDFEMITDHPAECAYEYRAAYYIDDFPPIYTKCTGFSHS